MWQGFLSKEIILIIFYTILRGISSRAKSKCLKILKKAIFFKTPLEKCNIVCESGLKKCVFVLIYPLGKCIFKVCSNGKSLKNSKNG